MNVSMKIKSEWIESFKNVFGLCEIKKSEKVIILSECSSRCVNVEIAKIALECLNSFHFGYGRGLILNTPLMTSL